MTEQAAAKPNYAQLEGNVSANGLAVQMDGKLLQLALRELFDHTITNTAFGEVREYGRLRVTVEKVAAVAGE